MENNHLGTRVPSDHLTFHLDVELSGAAQDLATGRRLAHVLAENCDDDGFKDEVRQLLELPGEFDIRFVPAASLPSVRDPQVADSPKIDIHAQYCPECTAYSWSKGCDSWPW